MNVKLQIDKFINKIAKGLGAVVDKSEMTKVGEEAIKIIVRRTKLGYGVAENLGNRERLNRLSPKYVKYRKKYSGLDGSTTAGRSNLTLTGQMLRSMKIIRVEDGKIFLSPSGRRRDGQSNEDIARYNAERGRPFNRLSLNEYKQLNRFYRKNFGDLLRKRNVIK